MVKQQTDVYEYERASTIYLTHREENTRIFANVPFTQYKSAPCKFTLSWHSFQREQVLLCFLNKLLAWRHVSFALQAEKAANISSVAVLFIFNVR